MAVKHTYQYETVEAGGEGDNSSPNDTLLEVANRQDLNQDILIALNPHLLSTGIIRGGTRILLYRDLDTNKETYYTVPSDEYDKKNSIYNIASKYSLDPMGLINQNKDVLSEHCCAAAGDKILYQYDELTHTSDEFMPLTMTITTAGMTLSDVSKQTNTKIDMLLSLNPNLGQTTVLPVNSIVLYKIASPSDGTTVRITGFGLQADTTRTLFVTWDWDNEENEVDNYRVKWEYQTSDGKWWIGSDGTTSDGDTKESLYGVDDKAIAARVTVKPSSGSSIISSADDYKWSTEQVHYFDEELTMLVPEISEVKIEHYKMTITAYVDTYPLKNEENLEVEFEIIQDDQNKYNFSGFIKVDTLTGKVSYSTTIAGGHTYHVRARSLRKNILFSTWTAYKGPYDAAPTIPKDISIEVVTETQIEIAWKKINSAKNYVVEYVAKNEDLYKDYTDQEYFTTGDVKSVTINSENVTEEDDGFISYDISNLVTGSVYLMRMCAVNDSATSDWSDILSFILGIKSKAPTTWSSTTTAVIGESLKLYWSHNSEDGSVERYANLRLIVDGVTKPDIRIVKSTDKEEKYETSVYEINTNIYTEGSKIEWMVQTAGVLTDENGPVFGEWSMKRTVDIYAPPVLSLNVTSSTGSNISDEALPLRSFPFNINLRVGNNTNQNPTGYYINITAIDDCTSIDNVGNTIYISPGTKVYSKYFDSNETNLQVTVSANDISLENNKRYLVSSIVSMSSGLTSETVSRPIKVAWNVTESVPFADVTIIEDTLTAQIKPYVNNKDSNVLLSIYRREFDGSFTEIHTDIQNGNNTVVIDPHPSLDYARYRIVARNQVTGGVSYNDIPAIAIKEKSIVIQWDEEWQTFDIPEGTTSSMLSSATYSGSMLKLPYNVDISNAHSQDVSHVRYIGRKRPVSYYGTQLGETATWNTVIPKHDKETLYALRRLAVWMGDVYVREPSGSGYWASITLSFSQAHRDLTIPVTINITPVEGGK